MFSLLFQCLVSSVPNVFLSQYFYFVAKSSKILSFQCFLTGNCCCPCLFWFHQWNRGPHGSTLFQSKKELLPVKISHRCSLSFLRYFFCCVAEINILPGCSPNILLCFWKGKTFGFLATREKLWDNIFLQTNFCCPCLIFASRLKQGNHGSMFHSKKKFLLVKIFLLFTLFVCFEDWLRDETKGNLVVFIFIMNIFWVVCLCWLTVCFWITFHQFRQDSSSVETFFVLKTVLYGKGENISCMFEGRNALSRNLKKRGAFNQRTA